MHSHQNKEGENKKSKANQMHLTTSNFWKVLQALGIILPAKLDNLDGHGQLTSSKALHQLRHS